MKRSRINLCYYPTNVILLDDNNEFLEALEIKVSRHIPVSIYDSPKKALEFFTDGYTSLPFVERCVANNNDEDSNHLMQDVDIKNISREIYNPDRFREITVLVVDYAMPDINGLEFSRLLRQKFPLIKIIMLTGEADQALAVEAFNEGIIDKFLMKSTENLIDTLINSIRELQVKYFNHLSEICFSKTNRFKEVLNCLTDPAFIEIFEQICKNNHIVEYFLMDNQGSFLLLNEHGEPSWFVVKTEQEIDNLYRYAEFEDAPKSITDALKNREKIPYFHTDKDMQTTPSEWEKFLLNAKRLEGKETYYYAYINDALAYDIQSEKVLSYRWYLDNLD